mmetsp:Transcript_2948/g.4231  ORF Transcript_2948/g.4231 Transcript_2948/m.4231 type:complete len:302 (-) Transcript_2948:17-922(-)
MSSQSSRTHLLTTGMAVVAALMATTHQIALAGALIIPSNKTIKSSKPYSTGKDFLKTKQIMPENTAAVTCTRKQATRRMMNTILTTGVTALFGAKPLQAACLSGDTNEECIGVYKVPIDDAILPYVGTKDQLLRYAPDVRWVPPVEYPKSYAEARKQLVSDLERLGALEDAVRSNADFASVGKLMLEVGPRVTVAGRVVLDALYTMEAQAQTQSNDTNAKPSMTAYKVEAALDELLVLFGQTDIALGQAIRGELGVVTVAQISILPSVKELVAKYMDLVRLLPAEDSIPKNVSSKRSTVKR